MKNIFILLFLFIISFKAFSQVAPNFVNINTDGDTFRPGDKAVLTVYKLAVPDTSEMRLYVEAQITSPDNSIATIGLRKVSNEVLMGNTSSLTQTGEYHLIVKVYLEESVIVDPLYDLIEKNEKRICKLEELIAHETDSDVLTQLTAEKAQKEAEIAQAKVLITVNREKVEEDTLVINVTSNQAPRELQNYSHPPFFVDVIDQSGNRSTLEICAYIGVTDPEDGEDYDWDIDFGDGNKIRFSNLFYHPDQLGVPRNYGCVMHTYFGEQRPIITYKAIDKDGASFTLTDTLDIRPKMPLPLPKVKVTGFEKTSTGIKVTFDPIASRIPSNSGLYLYRLFPQGRCGDLVACPDYFNRQVPLNTLTHTYATEGQFNIQFYFKDNLQLSRTTVSPVHIDPANVPAEPDQNYIDGLFGPVAIIQANRNTVEVEDLNVGTEIKFDGTSSFDYSGNDSSLKYFWEFGDQLSGNNFSNLKKPVHVYKNPGVYYVSLLVTDEHGNPSYRDWLMVHIINKNIKNATPDLQAYRNGNTQTVLFSMSQFEQLGGTTNFQYYWNFGDGTGEVTPAVTALNHTYAQPGSYEVSLTFQNHLGKLVTLYKTIDTTTTLLAPALTNGIQLVPGSFVLKGKKMTFDASDTIDDITALKYFWRLDEGKFAMGDDDESVQKLIYQATGMKEIRLNLTNAANFSSEFYVPVSVGDSKLEVSSFEITNLGNNKTKVDFTISTPSNPAEIKSIEIFNHTNGWKLIEAPTTLNFSEEISGVGATTVIVVTDISGNQNAFFKNFSKEGERSDEPDFPVSNQLMEYIRKSQEAGAHFRKSLSM